jgi:PAT family beta-lactamase induction signal transducer AmpG
MTQKRFSATQYALFSSLFGLPRIIAGPLAGFGVWAVGWQAFFWSTLAFGIPGMLLLARFVPLREREPHFEVKPPVDRGPLTTRGLLSRGLLGTAAGTVFAAAVLALLEALRAVREGGAFDVVAPLGELVTPAGVGDWVSLGGVLAFGIVCGLFTAAVVAARHGLGRELALAEGDDETVMS